MCEYIDLELQDGILYKVRITVPRENFKQEFLKRWGNIVKGGTNKGQRDYMKVKKIVYESNSLFEMCSRINRETKWVISKN